MSKNKEGGGEGKEEKEEEANNRSYKFRSNIKFMISSCPNPRLISSDSLNESSPCIPSDVVFVWMELQLGFRIGLLDKMIHPRTYSLLSFSFH